MTGLSLSDKVTIGAALLGGAAGGVLYRWLSAEPSGAVTGQPATR